MILYKMRGYKMGEKWWIIKQIVYKNRNEKGK
jgi:hypothetical protein